MLPIPPRAWLEAINENVLPVRNGEPGNGVLSGTLMEATRTGAVNHAVGDQFLDTAADRILTEAEALQVAVSRLQMAVIALSQLPGEQDQQGAR